MFETYIFLEIHCWFTLLLFLLFFLPDEIFFYFWVRVAHLVSCYRSLLQLQQCYKLLMNNISKSVPSASLCDLSRAISPSDRGNKSIPFSSRRNTCAREVTFADLAFEEILNGIVLLPRELSQLFCRGSLPGRATIQPSGAFLFSSSSEFGRKLRISFARPSSCASPRSVCFLNFRK